jgi:hypothetical protein
MNNNLKWKAQQISLTFMDEHLQKKNLNDGNDMNIARNENTKDPIDNI